MSARRLLLVSAALLLLLSARAYGQRCVPDDTPLTCWRKFNSVAAKTARMVATTNTGTPTATTLTTATALRDFLSFFSAGVDAGKVSEGGTNVTLDGNIPLSFAGRSDRIKVQALFNDPSLAEDVATPLGSKSGSAKDRLTNFDDVTALVSYSPVSRVLGRSIAPHAAFLDALEKANPDVAVELQKLGDALAKTSVPIDQNTKFSSIADAALQKEIILLVEAAAAVEKEAAARSASIVKALTRLINNQPQAYVSGSYHYRTALAGPDEWSAKVTFEIGPKSLNRFLRGNDDVCGAAKVSEKGNAGKCARRLAAFAAVEDPSRQPDAGDRFSFSFEYRQAKSESVDLSEFMVAAPVARGGAHSLVFSLTYGRPLSGAVFKNARIDAAVNYQDVSNDPKKTDRFVASLTFSQRINDTMTLPLSLTYANHTEYVPETDRHLGVHFGISYKIPDVSAK